MKEWMGPNSFPRVIFSYLIHSSEHLITVDWTRDKGSKHQRKWNSHLWPYIIRGHPQNLNGETSQKGIYLTYFVAMLCRNCPVQFSFHLGSILEAPIESKAVSPCCYVIWPVLWASQSISWFPSLFLDFKFENHVRTFVVLTYPPWLAHNEEEISKKTWQVEAKYRISENPKESALWEW